MRIPVRLVGTVVRGTGFAAIIALGVAALLHAVRHGPAPALTQLSGADAADPIAAELMRCQNVGLAAQDDRSCLAAWAENRRRFFESEPSANGHAHSADNTLPKQPER